MRDDEGDLINVHAPIQDEMQMVAGTYIPYLIETKVPHPSKAKATNIIEVTPEIVIEAPTPHTTTVAPTTNDIKVTPPVETNVTTPHETDVIAAVSTNPFVHTNEGFSGGLNVCYVLIGNEDHVAFRLWHIEVLYDMPMMSIYLLMIF